MKDSEGTEILLEDKVCIFDKKVSDIDIKKTYRVLGLNSDSQLVTVINDKGLEVSIKPSKCYVLKSGRFLRRLKNT